MPVKQFTPKEANQMLPLVRRVVDDILRIGRHVRGLSVEQTEKPEGEAEVTRLMDQMDELFEELEGLGCAYKDWNFSVGLVDFPSVIDDREVLLCWRSDEADIKYYHDPDTGFEGRKLIPGYALSDK